jgi:hypothetical protein
MRTHPLVFGVDLLELARRTTQRLRCAFLHERQVERLILPRPALEAGERPGLPAGRSKGEDRPIRPLYDDLSRSTSWATRQSGCLRWASRWRRPVHARPHPVAGVRNPRRSAKRDRAQMKMSHAPRQDPAQVDGRPIAERSSRRSRDGLNETASCKAPRLCGRLHRKVWLRHSLFTLFVYTFNRAPGQKHAPSAFP